jgi:hypothetical protein
MSEQTAKILILVCSVLVVIGIGIAIVILCYIFALQRKGKKENSEQHDFYYGADIRAGADPNADVRRQAESARVYPENSDATYLLAELRKDRIERAENEYARHENAANILRNLSFVAISVILALALLLYNSISTYAFLNQKDLPEDYSGLTQYIYKTEHSTVLFEGPGLYAVMQETKKEIVLYSALVLVDLAVGVTFAVLSDGQRNKAKDALKKLNNLRADHSGALK